MARREMTAVEEKPKTNGTATLVAPRVQELVRQIRTALVEAPIGECGRGYLSQHVEARLDVRQAEALKGLTAGLRDSRECTANGREVRTAADAVKWLLEKLSDSE